ncbi:acyl-CoA carboxylase subunit epsilon [Micropruina sp.]|uniref:acyl-CoA carboxylase subunit epsilon n=1 Tax=Micropruina sp. TaxID=2737536 RepID=UPI0039E4497F
MTGPAAPIVVHGHPSESELAALTAVLLGLRVAATTTASNDPQPPPSAWRSRSRQLRLPPRPGPGAWRASAWP